MRVNVVLWCVCLLAQEGFTYTLARTHTNTQRVICFVCEGMWFRCVFLGADSQIIFILRWEQSQLCANVQAPGDQSGKLLVRKQHLEAALRVILPSVSAKDEKRYIVCG